MSDTAMTLGMKTLVQGDYETVRQRTVDALKEQGFGVLTEIDVQATMKNKLDVDFRPYTILGACNPPLALRALTAAPEVGLLLPCNVTVAQVEDHVFEVSAIDPTQMLAMIDNPELVTVAVEAQSRLRQAINRLERTGGADDGETADA